MEENVNVVPETPPLEHPTEEVQSTALNIIESQQEEPTPDAVEAIQHILQKARKNRRAKTLKPMYLVRPKNRAKNRIARRSRRQQLGARNYRKAQ